MRLEESLSCSSVSILVADSQLCHLRNAQILPSRRVHQHSNSRDSTAVPPVFFVYSPRDTPCNAYPRYLQKYSGIDQSGIEYAFAYSVWGLSRVPPTVNADDCHSKPTHRAAPGDKIDVCSADRHDIDPIRPVPLEVAWTLPLSLRKEG